MMKWLLPGRIHKEERGQLLPLVLVLLFMGVTLIAGTLAYNSTTLRVTQRDIIRTKQIYAADAGVKDGIWQLRQSSPSLSRVPATVGETKSYSLPDIDDTALQVSIYKHDNTPTYRVSATATLSGSSSTVTTYVMPAVSLTNFTTKAITSPNEISTKHGTTVTGPVWIPSESNIIGGGDFTNATLEISPVVGWPDNADISDFYLDQVDADNPYTDTVLNVNTAITINARYYSGDLTIQGNGILTLAGTLYVNGTLTVDKNVTVELSQQTIYVAGDDPTQAIYAHPDATINGEGCIIASGGIDFQPNFDPDAYMFIMSINGLLNFQPAHSMNFTGSLAGNVSVDLKSGSFTYTPATGTLNVPPYITGTAALPGKIIVKYWSTATYTNGNVLSILTDTLENGEVGIPFSQKLSVSGGVPQYSWQEIGSLPGGLDLSSDGTISGTPLNSGNYVLTVRVTDSSEASADHIVTLNIFSQPGISTVWLPAGELTETYNQVLVVTGGSGDYSASLAGGSLPDGLDLSTDGTIAGTPTVLGDFNFTVKVEDSLGGQAVQSLTITVNNPLTITTTSPLPDGEISVYYSTSLHASDGTPSYVWSLAGGSLPGGISLDGDGTISGTPTASGTFTFNVRVSDDAGVTRTESMIITIVAKPVITTSSLANGTVDTAYSQSVTVTGGTSPYTWSASNLPAGLSIGSSNGTISGIPTTSGTYNNVSITVTDKNGVSATVSSLSIKISKK